MARFKPPGQCPVCGEWIPKGVVACDECGSCDKSGWKNPDSAQTYDGLDLPDDEFDYDEYVAREFGGSVGPSRNERQRFWLWVGLILFAVLLLSYVWPVIGGA